QSQSQSPQHRYQTFQSSEHGQRADEEMRRLDRNRDQSIDESEAQADPELIAAWADIDLSRDGSVDATEYYLFAAQRRIAQLETGAGQGSQQGSARGGDAGSRQQGAAADAGQRPGESRDEGGFAEQQRSAEQEAARLESGAQQEARRLEAQQRAAEQGAGQQPGAGAQGPGAGQQQAQAGGQGPGAGQQQGQQGSGQYPAFEEADSNSDGWVARTELATLEGIDFSTADANQDGFLSREEYREATQQ
ncbi:MAG: EF-hand domain-containing protein, partial [Gammaproteobacteria bacterium]|nr:EF-hand domain-containing protein [Gammaproteobacteria bacterium]